MAEDRVRCLAAGMDEYLAKPLRTEVLAMTLERCLHLADRVTSGGDAVALGERLVRTPSIGGQDQHPECSRMAG